MEKSETGYLIILGSIIIVFIIVFIFFILFNFYKRNKEYRKSISLLQYQYQQTLLQSQIEIQEQTLQHLSRELHDNLGQVASLIKINLTTLKLSEPEKAAEKIEHTKDLTRQLIADIKSLSVSLGSDRIAQTGLIKAIETEVERLNKTGEFIAAFQLQRPIPEIDNDKAVILYRMVQEVLNNMVKHSQAKHLNIFIHVKQNVFILALDDDGIGFNAEEKMNASGAGLRNLKNRALLINAQLHLKSLPGTGTEITIEMPL